MIERGRKLVDQSKQYWWERAKSVFLLIGGVQKEQQTGGWSLTDLATTALNERLIQLCCPADRGSVSICLILCVHIGSIFPPPGILSV